jgi:hypothetical protein
VNADIGVRDWRGVKRKAPPSSWKTRRGKEVRANKTSLPIHKLRYHHEKSIGQNPYSVEEKTVFLGKEEVKGRVSATCQRGLF